MCTSEACIGVFPYNPLLGAILARWRAMLWSPLRVRLLYNKINKHNMNKYIITNNYNLFLMSKRGNIKNASTPPF